MTLSSEISTPALTVSVTVNSLMFGIVCQSKLSNQTIVLVEERTLALNGLIPMVNTN
jgi:hypothetical protein